MSRRWQYPALGRSRRPRRPRKVPEGWKAEGRSQSEWNALYQQCLNIPAETTRRAHMSPEQLKGLKPIPGDWEGCKHIFSAISSRPVTASTPEPAVGISEKAPQWFIAEGSTQGQWTAIRENCNRNIAEMTRRGQLTAAQRSALPPSSFSHHDLMLCAHLSVSPPIGAQTSPAPAPGGPAPTPVSTPLSP